MNRLSFSPLLAIDWLKSRSLLDRSFEISIILKGLDGALEILGGALLLAVSPAAINHIVFVLTQSELSRDPHDFVATHILSTASHLTGASAFFGALYLLSHGAVKVILVIAVLKDKLWAYPWMIGFLILFIVYQLYRLTFAPTFGLAALTLFDGFVAVLTYLEYRKHQSARAN